MNRRNKMSPEQWQQYLAARNQQEGKGLKICGTALIVYALLFGALVDITKVVLFPWEGICAVTIAGSAYELFFCVRAFLEGEDMHKHIMKISAIFILVGLGIIMMVKQIDVAMPVLIMYPVLIVIGYCLRKAGKERLDEKWPK